MSSFINWLLPSETHSFKVVIDMAGDFMQAVLNWMSMIVNFIIANPMIMIFFTVGLAGVAFGFLRRVVRLLRF
jgi:phage-related protein